LGKPVETIFENSISKAPKLFRIFDEQGLDTQPTIASQHQQRGRDNVCEEFCIDNYHSFRQMNA
jgi:hypothetical protein